MKHRFPPSIPQLMPEPTGFSYTLGARALAAFNAFAFLGLALNAAVLATAFFSPSVQRRTTWSQLIKSFLIYSLSYLMIVPWQNLPQSQPPPFGLCFVQATLVYASPALVTMSYTAFVIDFFLQVSAIRFCNSEHEFETIDRQNTRMSKFLVIVPWTCFFVIIFIVVVVPVIPSTFDEQIS